MSGPTSYNRGHLVLPVIPTNVDNMNVTRVWSGVGKVRRVQVVPCVVGTSGFRIGQDATRYLSSTHVEVVLLMMGNVISRVITPHTRFSPTIWCYRTLSTMQNHSLGVFMRFTRLFTRTLRVISGVQGLYNGFWMPAVTSPVSQFTRGHPTHHRPISFHLTYQVTSLIRNVQRGMQRRPPLDMSSPLGIAGRARHYAISSTSSRDVRPSHLRLLRGQLRASPIIARRRRHLFSTHVYSVRRLLYGLYRFPTLGYLGVLGFFKQRTMDVIRVTLISGGLQTRPVTRFLFGLLWSVQTSQYKVTVPVRVFFPHRLIGSRHGLIGGNHMTSSVRVQVLHSGSTRPLRKMNINL